MDLFSLEHSKAGYWADFVAYGAAVVLLSLALATIAPHALWLDLSALVLVGLAAWSLIEYGMHRFVLHGLEPFRSWHARHHERPRALISAPTALSATLIFLLVFVPSLPVAGPWPAAALTLGVTIGYLGYAVTHHATHHWRPRSPWLTERKRWHALHHRDPSRGCYGVSSSLWDRVFGTFTRTGSR